MRSTHRARNVFTIGYAGHTPESFLETIQAKRITLLVDIRTTPISRKPGFSKSALAARLAKEGIRYEHLRILGSPAELRHKLHETGDYDTFFQSYREYLRSQPSGLGEIAELAEGQRMCLMCVESCPDECHRSIVAQELLPLLGHGVTISHLLAPCNHSKES